MLGIASTPQSSVWRLLRLWGGLCARRLARIAGFGRPHPRRRASMQLSDSDGCVIFAALVFGCHYAPLRHLILPGADYQLQHPPYVRGALLAGGGAAEL